MSMAMDYAIDSTLDYLWLNDSIAEGGANAYFIEKTSGYTANPDNIFDFWFGADSASELASKFNVISGSDYAVSGGNLEVYSTSGSTQTKLKAKTTHSINSIIENRCKGSASDLQGLSYIGMEDSDGSDSIVVYDKENNSNSIYHFTKRYGTYTQSTLSCSDLTSWHTYKIIWTGGHSKLYQDGTLLQDKTSNIPEVDTYLRFSNAANEASGSTMYHDWIRVRKHVATEPTVTVIDKATHYEVHVENTGSTELTDYQIAIPCSSLGISSATESVYVEKLTGNLLEGQQLFIS